MAPQDNQGNQDSRDPRVLLVTKVFKGLLGYLVHKDLRVQPDRMVCQVLMDQQDLKDQVGHREFRDNRVQQDRGVNPDQQGKQASRALRDRTDRRVPLDQ